MAGSADDDGRTQRERMLAGDPYIASDPELVEESRRAVRLTERYNRSSVDEVAERRRILRELLGSVGDEVEIRPPLHCDYGFQIHIGARTFINFNLTALDVARITIGDDAQIGPNVQLLTPTHPSRPRPAAPSSRRPSPSRSATTCGSAAA
jgi:maltose O-acetyltransferase